MSFYTGKYNGKNVCHITKGQHDISTMRGAPFSSTVFHTDVDYLDYKIFNLGAGTDCEYNGLTTGATPNPADCKDTSAYYMPEEVQSYIFDNNYAFSIYDNTNKTMLVDRQYLTAYAIDCLTVLYFTSLNSVVWAASSYYPQWVVYDDGCRASPYVKNPAAQTPKGRGFPYMIANRAYKNRLSIIVWGIKNNGQFAPIYNPSTSGDIRIKRNSFKVGSLDVGNIRYLSPSFLNNSDLKINDFEFDGDFQLIGSTAKGASLNIISNNSKTEISRAGSVILSSNMGNTMIDISSSVVSSVIPRKYQTWSDQGVISFDWKVLVSNTIYSLGQVIFANVKFEPSSNMWENGYGHSSSLTLKYKEGTIGRISEGVGSENDSYTEFYGISGKIYHRYYAEYVNTADRNTVRGYQARTVYITKLS